MHLAHSLYYSIIMLLILLLFSFINKHPYVCISQGISILYIFSSFLIEGNIEFRTKKDECARRRWKQQI